MKIRRYLIGAIQNEYGLEFKKWVMVTPKAIVIEKLLTLIDSYEKDISGIS